MNVNKSWLKMKRGLSGNPGVTLHCDSEKQNDSLELPGQTLNGSAPESRSHRNTCEVWFTSSLLVTFLIKPWLFVSDRPLLIGGQCCYQVPPGGRGLAPAQGWHIKAGMEVPGYQLCMKKCSPRACLLLFVLSSFFSKAHPPPLPPMGSLWVCIFYMRLTESLVEHRVL